MSTETTKPTLEERIVTVRPLLKLCDDGLSSEVLSIIDEQAAKIAELEEHECYGDFDGCACKYHDPGEDVP